MTRLSVLALFAALCGVACATTPIPVPANPVDACAQLCEHGRGLRCTWAEATMQGHSCEEVCENANDPAGPIQWDMSCRINGGTCDAVSRCQ